MLLYLFSHSQNHLHQKRSRFLRALHLYAMEDYVMAVGVGGVQWEELLLHQTGPCNGAKLLWINLYTNIDHVTKLCWRLSSPRRTTRRSFTSCSVGRRRSMRGYYRKGIIYYVFLLPWLQLWLGVAFADKVL